MTPPLSPDQQLQLKQEAEALETWANDAEVECYLSYNENDNLLPENDQQNVNLSQSNSYTNNSYTNSSYTNNYHNNIVINDRIWCEEKSLTPTELLTDSFIKHKTPTPDDFVAQSSHIRPITPCSPTKREVHCSTPLKVDESPMKKPQLTQRIPPKLDLGKLPELNIKEEPVSPTFVPLQNLFAPPALKMSTESSFTTSSVVRIKEEPVERTPPRPEFQIRIPKIKQEPSYAEKSKVGLLGL